MDATDLINTSVKNFRECRSGKSQERNGIREEHGSRHWKTLVVAEALYILFLYEEHTSTPEHYTYFGILSGG